MARVMTTRKRIILVFFIIFSCIGCDQITKEIAQSQLPRMKVLSFAGDTLRLDYTENKGAVLSFEYCLPEGWRGSTLTVAVAVFLGLLIFLLVFTSFLRLPSVIALSLLCGGSLSNLLDRIAFGGNVVDFLSLGWGGVRSAIFNVADAAITMGAALFFISILWSLCSSPSHRPSCGPADAR
jgi:signal peptidase II